MNPITLIDGYKLDHRRQYPDHTTRVYSNFTPRGSRIPLQDEVVFVGLQYFITKYLMEEMQTGFFDIPKDVAVAEYQRRIDGYLGPNTVGTEHIAALWDLGYIPLVYRAFPEGSKVPLKVPMLTVESTNFQFAWLVNYFETLMSCVLWGPSTSATSALRLRTLLDEYATTTGSAPEFVDWQGHDFSFRGMFGPEAAAMSGLGHLLYFTGTDTIPAIDLVEQYYFEGLPTDYLIGGSVAATEHSVMCAGGQMGERETFERLLNLYPEGIVSVVSDTWDLWHVLTETVPSLKDHILARNGKLVIRPDSGDPTKIICGDMDAEPGSPARKGVIQLLWDTFGGTETSTGHRLLDEHIGCIYGDSITYERAKAILEGLSAHGFSSGNMVFGVGSFTYQYTTRDTYNFAMKATWAEVDGEGVDMFKNPVTDDGMKASAKGRLAVLDIGGVPTLINQATPEEEAASLLRPVWADGEWIDWEDFATIRERARS